MNRPLSPTWVVLTFWFDLLLTAAALAAAQGLRVIAPLGQYVQPHEVELDVQVYFLALAIWAIVFTLLSVYTSATASRPRSGLATVAAAVGLSAFVLSGALYFSFREVSRLLFLYFGIIDLVLLVGYRAVLYSFSHPKPYRFVIVGVGEFAGRVADHLSGNQPAANEVLGFLAEDEASGDSYFAGYPVLGKVANLEAVARQLRVQDFCLALELSSREVIGPLVARIRDLPANVWVPADLFALSLARSTIEDIEGAAFVRFRTSPLTPRQQMLKRALDLILASVGLLILWPLFVLIAIAIKVDSPGPVIFKQQRIGEHGVPFRMYKFRSMVANAEELSGAGGDRARSPSKHKVRDDPRVTRVGRFLRTTSLDELPQLVNVLKGAMSIVGPRPEMPYIVAQYEPWQRRRLAVPQGITGWWQVNGRSDKPLMAQIDDDLYYIENYSNWLDLQILWKTVGAIFTRRGAF